MLRLADGFGGIVVVDEAYIDFSEEEGLCREIFARPNLVVLQTLSKAWAMAGLRVGLALADRRVVELMSMVKYPYNIDVAAMRMAERLLDDPIDEKVERVYPSDANFLLVRVDDADAVYDRLIGEGIIVRNRSRIEGCEGCLRITIGLEEENMKLLKTLERYEKESIVR